MKKHYTIIREIIIALNGACHVSPFLTSATHISDANLSCQNKAIKRSSYGDFRTTQRDLPLIIWIRLSKAYFLFAFFQNCLPQSQMRGIEENNNDLTLKDTNELPFWQGPSPMTSISLDGFRQEARSSSHSLEYVTPSDPQTGFSGPTQRIREQPSSSA